MLPNFLLMLSNRLIERQKSIDLSQNIILLSAPIVCYAHYHLSITDGWQGNCSGGLQKR